jgi:stage III sporulation protein AG
MRWLQPGKKPAAGEPSDGEPVKPLLGDGAGRVLALLALVGAAMMLLARGGGVDKPAASVSQAPEPAPVAAPALPSEELMRRELKALLAQISGVGAVELYITYDTGTEQVIAEEVTSQRSASTGERNGAETQDVRESRRPVTIRDDAAKTEKPLVLVQKEPRVRGVIVVAEGGASARVRYEVARAVQAALDVPAHRIGVFPMKP